MKMFVLTAVVFAICCLNIAGQNRTTVSGTVTDGNGDVVPGASIRLVNAQQIAIRSTVADSNGQYIIQNVPPGSYAIIASRSGFGELSKATVIGSNPSTIDLVLSLDQLSENVTVTANTGSVDEINKIPIQINVVSPEELSQRTTGVLAQVADEEPGASMQRTSPTIGAVLVRGLTEVGVYVDGVRYTNSTQRGGINTFFNLNDASALRSVEIQRSPNTAQFGSDGLGGNVQLLSRQPEYGFDKPRWNGEFNTFFNSADSSFGGNTIVGYGAKRYGVLANLVARRINPIRPGRGIDSHSAITRFLGLPSNIVGSERLPDTTFTQYGGTIHANATLTDDQTISVRYQRSQQDGGKRYDQLIGGDGNLIADLKNLMLDFGHVRYFKTGVGFFDDLSMTVSYNSQREERINQGGQGNPLATITNDKERTTTWGASFFLDKQMKRHSLLIGGDLYHDSVNAPSFSTDPVSRIVTQTRPRVPNGSSYTLAGVYVQNAYDAIHNRLKISGALRFNYARYSAKAADAPIVNGQPLFPDDKGTFRDLSGRIGATVTIAKGVNTAFNYSRGFRSPNITSLGGLGLVGVGFQVSTQEAIRLNGLVGTTGDASAVSSGVNVTPLRSEISNNFDVSLRYHNKRFDGNVTGFLIDYGDTIVRQTLILPAGAVGQQLGSQTITNQIANGAVFVSAATTPVLVQANFSNTRMKGVEANFEYRFLDAWTVAGNASYVHAADRATGVSPNLGGGGIPPAFGFLRLRYQPQGSRFWLEAYANAAGDQSRLSTLDIADRRTGGARTRSQMQNFIRRGACVRGITYNTLGAPCGTANNNYILAATGETLTQVLNRMLPIGSVVNGVLVVNNDTAVPLFNSIPGYVLFNVRGGYRIDDRQLITVDLENLADRSHRAPGWGIDGPGRSLTMRYQIKF